MGDKRISEDDFISELKDDMVIGIGGWGSRRKPMGLVKAIIRSGVKNLHIVSYGGPDVGLLCASGQLSHLTSGFVSLDSIPLEPHFRAARQQGKIRFSEIDEGMLQWGLMAATHRVSFLPTRAGLASDVMKLNPHLKTVRSPYDESEELVAMPALPLDLSILHVNRADALGNGQILGVDPYFDDLFASAAKRTIISCEKIVPTSEFIKEGPVQTLKILRLHTHGVVEMPYGAHFTSCDPDYGRDEDFQAQYAKAAKDPNGWEAFAKKFVHVENHDAYRRAIGR